MEKLKQKLNLETINLETILCMFIIACPILDMVSFLFRNTFHTSISPSTVLRPVISIVAILYLFIKKDKKFKCITMGLGLLYVVYGIIHLYLFQFVKTQSSYSTVFHEAQYVANYSFMILNLLLYTYVFINKPIKFLKKSVLIAAAIYVISIFIAVLTGTSSHTYLEGIGYKGWFESGNSISSILVLAMFICLPYVRNKKERKIAIPILILMGIFLTTIIGTRVGLFGFILVLFTYILVEIVVGLLHNKKVSKKIVIGGLIGIAAVIVIVGAVGSSTIQRRKHLQVEENEIIDPVTGTPGHITGDLLTIKGEIDKQALPETFMRKPEQKSIQELYDITKKENIAHTQMRLIQLIYNVALVKNQANPILFLFGNGYMTNFRELVLEMEIPAFLFNFGLLGFILYFIPFLTIFALAAYIGIKKIRQVDVEYIMLVLGSGFTFALSFFSGYTFFNSSSMMIIVVIHALLCHKIYQLKKES